MASLRLSPLMKRKGYPFEEPIPLGLAVTGVILADQIRTMDWVARRAKYLCALPLETVESAYARFAALMPAIPTLSPEEDRNE